MKFGPVPLAEAKGAILAHAVRLGRSMLKKGIVLGEAELTAMAGAGMETVTVARLEAGDVEENEAARRVARSLAGGGVTAGAASTGRVNLFAESSGVMMLDPHAIERLNRVTDDVTIATLPNLTPVEAGRMIATVKIIPFSVPGSVLADCLSPVAGLTVLPFRPLTARLIQTVNDGLKPSVIEKTSRVTAERMTRLGGELACETHCPHETGPLAAAIRREIETGCDILLVIGASAIVDRGDVIPAAIEMAGGRIERLGMPVDPGNLILIAGINGAPVLGLPGCARSPSRNGLDWVLERLAAGIAVGGRDVAAMGVGGLLIGGKRRRIISEIAAIILAAGQSRRWGQANKLLAPVDGVPMVRRVAGAVLASSVRPVVVVTGHEAEKVSAALAGLSVRMVDAGRFALGMAESLKAGIEALPGDCDGALVCLGDMPFVHPATLNQLAAEYDPAGAAALIPTCEGERGNPVLLGRSLFSGILGLSGDRGARAMLHAVSDRVREVAVDDPGILRDVDAPGMLVP